jgi:hypothetical protein
MGVVLATAATDAVYVMFTAAVIARRRVSAAITRYAHPQRLGAAFGTY